MKFLAIIPARKGSKGIKNKNYKNFNGKPLIYWTIKAARKCKFIDKLIVSTNSKIIRNYALSQKIMCPFLRPENISNSKSRAKDVILHTINFLKANYGYMPDAIIYLQPTSPLRETKDIDEACKKYIFYKPDSLVSIVRIHHNHNSDEQFTFKKEYRLKKVLNNKNQIPLRQSKKKFYGKNGAAISITKINKIKHFVDGGDLLGFEMHKLKSIDIDDIDDFRLAEIIQKKFKFNS